MRQITNFLPHIHGTNTSQWWLFFSTLQNLSSGILQYPLSVSQSRWILLCYPCAWDSQFSHSVMSDSWRPHGLQHTRLPYPSPTPGACSNSCHWVSDAIQPSRPLLSPSPPIFSSIRVFSNESVLHLKWPKYWSFSFSISPSNEYSGLISFRMDWFDLLAVLGTLKSLLQHHSSKASILWHSAFLIVQLSHPYMTTGKAIA